MSFDWLCPFCDRHSTITKENVRWNAGYFNENNKYGVQEVQWRAISCPNPSCREYSFDVWVFNYGKPPGGGEEKRQDRRHGWQLVPNAHMRVMPDYVPVPIVEDYKEACSIATLSPKASATLSRRCLQGMIRDFWGVKSGRLVDEIKAIEGSVDKDAWAALEAVRRVGNIGAHMEADINLIVDVDPDEAKLMIGLIESLVDEWYVSRHDRKTRFGRLAEMADEKQQARKKAPESSKA